MLNESYRVFTFKYTSLKIEFRPIVKEDNKMHADAYHWHVPTMACGVRLVVVCLPSWQIRLHIHNYVHLPSTDA